MILGRGGGKEKGKAQIKLFRPNNWGYLMRDILRGQRAGMGQSRVELRQTSLWTVYSMMIM